MIKIILGLLLIFVAGCSLENVNGQQVGDDSLTANKPQTKIIVNKEYDENGNLVKFDSSYSYFYSNMVSDSTFGDSSYNIFRNDFFNSFPNIQKPFLDDVFFEDSLLNYDFYKDNFFTNRFKYNRKRFDKLFEEMDSLKNKFYQNIPNQNRK